MNSFLAVTAMIAFLSAQPQTPSVFERQLLFERRAVAEMQQIPTSNLDAELPSLPFANWFEKVVGPGAGVSWQLGECADQRKEEPTNDLRACVETSAILPDGRKALIKITVGTFRKGRIGSPAFSFGAIEQKGELYLVRRLRDLPRQLWAPEGLKRPAVKLPEVNLSKVRLSVNNPYIAAPLWDGEEISLPLTLEEPPPSEPPPQKPPSAAESQSASGRLVQGAAIYKAQPIYPPNARRFNASGPVEVRITISAEGRVSAAAAVSGHLLLRDAAVEAARKWVFKPTTVNGVPVETQLALTFVFTVPQ